jgi:hypothetical protein
MGRPPEPKELTRLEQFCDFQDKAFRDDPDGARKLIGAECGGDPAPPATLVALSRVLLNLDELITRP